MRAHYRHVPYHNFFHCVDVTHATFRFIRLAGGVLSCSPCRCLIRLEHLVLLRPLCALHGLAALACYGGGRAEAECDARRVMVPRARTHDAGREAGAHDRRAVP